MRPLGLPWYTAGFLVCFPFAHELFLYLGAKVFMTDYARMEHAWVAGVACATDRLVLVAAATSVGVPSVVTIVHLTGLSRRKVRRSLRHLDANGSLDLVAYQSEWRDPRGIADPAEWGGCA